MNTIDQTATPPTGAAWRRPIAAARVVITLVLTLLVTGSLDLWVRWGVLPFRRTPEGRVAAFNRLARLWGIVTFGIPRALLGFRVRVEGPPPASGRCFVISNHQSSLDVPLLCSLFRGQNLKFVAMEELLHGKPGVSLALRHGGFAVVAKQDLGVDLAHLDEFGRNLARFEGSPAIFPEGKRTLDGEVLPFHLAGTEIIRRRAKLPIVPVTIDGLWPARTIKELDRVIGADVTVRIHDPIPHEEIEKDPRAAYARIEARIRADIDEIRGRSGTE